jgi:hypothetical protein
MARGGHGLPKVSPGPAMPDPFTPCGRATPGGPLPFSTRADTPRRTPTDLRAAERAVDVGFALEDADAGADAEPEADSTIRRTMKG